MKLEGFTDDTQYYVETILNLYTPLVHDIYQYLSTNSKHAYSDKNVSPL